MNSLPSESIQIEDNFTSMSIGTVNIILDIFILIFSSLTILISFVMILIMSFSKNSTSVERTAHLLCLNMFASLLFGCMIMLDMYCYTLYGHLHPNISFNNQRCFIRSYLLYVSGCSFFYSYLLQAIYRLCRIVFFKNPGLQSIYLYIGGISIQWIFSFLQVIPVYLFGAFEYIPEDYHCQISVNNIKGLLTGLSLVHMIPISLTTVCYIYTIRFLRKRRHALRPKVQRASDRRDLCVLRRMILLLVVMICSGLPQLGLSISSQYFGYLPYWSTQFQWLTATFSVFCIACILMFVSPNLQNIFRRSSSSQNDMFIRNS